MKRLMLKILPMGALLVLLLLGMGVVGCDISPVPTPIPGNEASPVPPGGVDQVGLSGSDTIEDDGDIDESDTTEDESEETDTE